MKPLLAPVCLLLAGLSPALRAGPPAPPGETTRMDGMIGFIFDPLHAWNVTQENFDRLREMGGGLVRFPVRWSTVEPTPDNWQWTEIDDAIARARAADLELMVILGLGPAAPSWAPGFRDVNALPYLADWVDYVRTVTARYADDVAIWEIGNEPFTAHGRMVPNHQYATFLRAAYRTAKAIDADATVIHGGVRYQDDHAKVIDFVLAPGAGRFTDGLNFHTLYRSADSPEDRHFARALTQWNALADAWNVEPALYLTESAWATPPTGVTASADRVSEGLQAAYSLRTLIIGLAEERLQTIVNAWLLGDSHDQWSYWDDTGFVREDGAPKKAYTAMQFARRTLEDVVFHEERHLGPGVECYVFHGDAARVSILWGTSPTAQIVAWRPRVPNPRFFDQIGGELHPPFADDTYELRLSRHITYVVERP